MTFSFQRMRAPVRLFPQLRGRAASTTAPLPVQVRFTPVADLRRAFAVGEALERVCGVGTVELLDEEANGSAAFAFNLPAGTTLGDLLRETGLSADGLHAVVVGEREAVPSAPAGETAVAAPADERDDARVAPRTIVVRAYPFVLFSEVNDALMRLRGVPGVRAARLRRLREGVLHLDVDYSGRVPLGTRLEPLRGRFTGVTWETDGAET